MTSLHALALLAAGFVAGVMNAIAGGGTLVTFPALLATGLNAKIANATSTLALFPGLWGSLYGYRGEIGKSRSYLFPLGVASVAGGIAGTIRLIATPSGLSPRLVPTLFWAARRRFAGQDYVSRWCKAN